MKLITSISTMLVILLSVLAMPAMSHPGGLDKNGGHTNKKTSEYHCHKDGCKGAKAINKSSKNVKGMEKKAANATEASKKSAKGKAKDVKKVKKKKSKGAKTLKKSLDKKKSKSKDK